MFFLYLYPLDFRIKPKTIDAIGIGVIKKNAHIFSTNNPFTFDTTPTKANAPKMDNNDATNNEIEIVLHLFGMGASIIFDGFLYIYE